MSKLHLESKLDNKTALRIPTKQDASSLMTRNNNIVGNKYMEIADLWISVAN